MTTIYIVTSGEYSDYRISGVFSTPEKTDLFISNNDPGGCRGMSVEPWELDKRQYDTPKTVWACNMSVKTGEITHEWDYTKSCGPLYTDPGVDLRAIGVRSSISRDHARELAAEKRQEYLREN